MTRHVLLQWIGGRLRQKRDLIEDARSNTEMT
jgi:hypothetical protein